MKISNILFPVLVGFLMSLASCSTDDDAVPDPDDDNGSELPEEPSGAELIDLSTYSSGQKVMMQAFYWDVEPRHEWWTNLAGKVEGWADAGIDRIWLPPATKGQSGGYSMGYDVSDYFDFGEYDQHGTVPTRFGTREELENLIATAHDNDLEVIADIVLNHNSGGGLEDNPYRGYETYTLFNEEHGNASGMFNRHYEYFHPNSIHEHDEGDLFFSEQDVCHHQPYVQEWLWERDNSVAKYYKNEMEFDGWRFDYVRGFGSWVITEWMDEVGGFAVAENWIGDTGELAQYVEETGISAFDFAAFYKMEEAFDRHDDLSYLEGDMLRKSHPEQAVTFVANHDTEKDVEENRIAAENKMKAYAYILTHDGYPTIFYSDYESDEYQDEIQQLIRIHNSIAVGEVEIIFVDDDEYIMRRNGEGDNPGLILYVSTNNNIKRRTVNTNWNSATIMDYSESTNYTTSTTEDGTAIIEAPANGYAVYSIMEE